MSTINILGPVGYNPTGNYDPTRTYQKLDVVYYQGSSYVAISDSIGQLPTNGEYWNCIATGALKQFTYNSVAEMKLDTSLEDEMFVETAGYYSVNDGGGAIYKITNEESETEYQEELENGLYATLITNGYLNLMQIGCYGDGVHDDTARIKFVINLALENNLVLTSSPNKTYLVSELITFGDMSIDLSMCTFKTDYGIKFSSVLGKILNIPVVEAISDLSQNSGVELFECYTNKIYISNIKKFTKGLILTASAHGCCYNNITIDEIYNCLTSIELYPTSSGWVNENLFIGGRLWCTGTFNTAHGANIIKIYLHGNNNSTVNNNYFLHQCVEGNEGSSNGLKLKLEYARYCVFEQLRYEGTNAKVTATNCLYNVMNNGYNLSEVTFTDQKVTRYLFGTGISLINSGNNSFEANPAGGSYAAYATKRFDGNYANKITMAGFIACDTSGNEKIRVSPSGLEAYENNAYYFMARPWGKYILVPDCDFTKHAIVINSGSNVTNGCYLWMYDGHLYGKIGQPSSESDGTVIL